MSVLDEDTFKDEAVGDVTVKMADLIHDYGISKDFEVRSKKTGLVSGTILIKT